MATLKVIGIGAGHPDFITQQAIRALNELGAVLVFDKGDAKDELVALRRSLCETYITGAQPRMVVVEDPARDREAEAYESAVVDWHAERGAQLAAFLTEDLQPGEVAGILVWGDPMLYDSTLRVVGHARTALDVELDLEVVPGITSVQTLMAAHQEPLNEIGQPVHWTTGRRLAAGETGGARTVVVMLDAHLACKAYPQAQIFWGAYLGMPDQLLVQGTVAEVIGEIEQLRAEARERKGWIMDTYLLRLPE